MIKTNRREGRRIPGEISGTVAGVRTLLGPEHYHHGAYLTWYVRGGPLVVVDLGERLVRAKYGHDLVVIGEWDDLRDPHRVLYQLEHTLRLASYRLVPVTVAA